MTKFLLATAALSLFAAVTAYGPSGAVSKTASQLSTCSKVSQEHAVGIASEDDVREACKGSVKTDTKEVM